LNILVQEIMAI